MSVGELYGTADPYELDNLAQNPECAKEKAALRTALKSWMRAQGDTGANLDRQQKLDENRAAFGWKK